MNHTQKTLGRSLSWIASTKLAGLMKMSFIIGSQAAFFSASSITTPLIGAFNSKQTTLALFAVLALFKLLVAGSFDLSFLAFIIPGLCASLYWNSNPFLIRVCLPIMCMLLFIVHSGGFTAAPYALFWLIPIALYSVKHNNLFLHALSSTFIAHAVGSVIWMYTVPMAASAWLALMPVVCIERFAFASGMVIMHSLITWCSSAANRITTTAVCHAAQPNA